MMENFLEIGKKNLTSIILSLFVISLLIFSNSASAVRILWENEKDTYKDDEYVTLKTSIDIQNGDILQINDIKIILNEKVKCISDSEGNNNCNGFYITRTEGQELGYGYGFVGTHGKVGLNGEVKYEIKIDTSILPPGDYNAKLEIHGEVNSIPQIISPNQVQQFRVLPEQNIKAITNNRITARTINGEVSNINQYNYQGRQRIISDIDLRLITQNNIQKLDGKILINVNTQQDSARTSLKLSLIETIEIIEFNQDIIQIKGNFIYDYRRSNNGIWLFGNRIGAEPTIAKKGEIPATVIINNEEIIIYSNQEFLFDLQAKLLNYRFN
ncbi:MAG: hypothetical protein ACMXYG_04400 [Candidatus Woesearchaeota archaeon]